MRAVFLAVLIAAACGGGRETLPFEEFRRFFPPEVEGLPKTLDHGSAMREGEASIPIAVAIYMDEETGESLQLTIMDWISVPDAVQALRQGQTWSSTVMAAYAMMTAEAKTIGGRPGIAYTSEESDMVAVQVLVGDAFVVTAQSDMFSAEGLERAIGQMDLAGLEGLGR